MDRIISIEQLISFFSFTLFIILCLWFLNYILKIKIGEERLSSYQFFFRTSFKSPTKEIRLSENISSIPQIDKSMMTFSDIEKDYIFFKDVFIVDDNDVQSLSFHNNEYDENFHSSYNDTIHIRNLIIESDLTILVFKDIKIGNLIIKGNIKHMDISNCWIQHIKFENKNNISVPYNISFLDTHINLFDLENGRVGDLFFDNCTISNFITKETENDHDVPLTGDLSFNNTSLFEETGTHANSRVLVSLRNLKNLLDKSFNKKASRYVLGHIRKIERRNFNFLSKFVDFMYDSISFYNNTPERALGYIGFILLIMYSFLFVADLNICIDNGKKIINFSSTSFLNYCNESFLFMIQSLLSPISTLTGNEYYALQNINLRFLYGILNVIILLLITLYGFALKLRYSE